MPDARWDPRGEVLLVGRSIPPEAIAHVRSRLPDGTLQLLDLAESSSGAAVSGVAVSGQVEDDLVEGAPSDPPPSEAASQGFPPESDAAVAAIEQVLHERPRISSLLAHDRWAARDIWRVVRDRPHYLGFSHIDSLERARRTLVHPDCGPVGRRRASHRFAYEFAGEDPLDWRPGARVRLLIGPGNQHGRASGWARAARQLRGVDAMALAVGASGHPAELMATPADWETSAVRNQILARVASATHVLLDEEAGDHAAAVAEAAKGRVVRAAAARLPVAVPSLPPRSHAGRRPHAIVLGRTDDRMPPGWRVTRLARVPRSLWVLAAMGADVIVDARTQPWLDVPVVAGMAQGAVLVADLPRRRLRRRIPHVRSLAELPDAAALDELSRESLQYARSRHADVVVARRLRLILRVV